MNLDRYRWSGRFKRLAMALVPILMFLTGIPAKADQLIKWAGYDIHYATFSSMIIPGEVAEAHNIIRSPSRIVTNISVRKAGRSVKSTVTGESTNLLSQVVTMDFIEVSEQEAIYYLSNQVINERDTVRFAITIQPADTDQTYQLTYKRQYF